MNPVPGVRPYAEPPTPQDKAVLSAYAADHGVPGQRRQRDGAAGDGVRERDADQREPPPMPGAHAARPRRRERLVIAEAADGARQPVGAHRLAAVQDGDGWGRVIGTINLGLDEDPGLSLGGAPHGARGALHGRHCNATDDLCNLNPAVLHVRVLTQEAHGRINSTRIPKRWLYGLGFS